MKSEKARKESEKANRFRDNLCKRNRRKRAIDSSESGSDSEGSGTSLDKEENFRHGSREKTSFQIIRLILKSFLLRMMNLNHVTIESELEIH